VGLPCSLSWPEVVAASRLCRHVEQKQFTPQQAEQVSPEVVRQLAAHAEKADPWLIDKASAFYSEHLTLIKTMGGGALTVGASGRIVAVLRDFAPDVQVES